MMLRNRLSRTVIGIFAAAALAALPACSSPPKATEPAPASVPAGTSAGQNAPAAKSGTATISTKLLKFEPEKLTVQKGTTVTWQVPDSLVHNVTTGTFTIGGDGLRTSENPDGMVDKPLKKGQNVTYTFDKPGTYTYYCSIHKGMRGQITVTA